MKFWALIAPFAPYTFPILLDENAAAKVKALDPKTEKLDALVDAVKDEKKVVCGLNTN
jgi:hypothetical protein